MASITKIVGKKGFSYKLTAFSGYDSHGKQIRKTKTWKPDKNMSAKQAEKRLYIRRKNLRIASI